MTIPPEPDDIFEYIANILYEPDTAKRQVGKIIEKIDGLDTLPFHFPLYADESWRGHGLRFFPAGNYLVVYLPIEKVKRVEIVRVMYGRCDIKGQLEETFEIK